jgi:erythromycin esterase
MSPHLNTFSTLSDWIATEAIPFSLDDLPSVDSAVDKIVTMLGDTVELLGLGEPTHQVETFLMFRNRVFQRLVQRHGYTAIAIESSYPRGRLANEYVSGRGKSSFENVIELGFSHQFGNMQSNRQLIEWMRSFNAEHTHRPLRFDGFDGPMEMMYTDSPRALLHAAIDYLVSIDGANAQARRSMIDQLIGDDGSWESQEAAFDPSKSIGLTPAAKALRAEVEQLSLELHDRRDELIAAAGEERFLEAAHNINATMQLLAYHAIVATPSDERLSNIMSQRDAIQAENLNYIVGRERCRGGKVLAFAHNGHLKMGQMEWLLGDQKLAWSPAGTHVRRILGESYRVIGMGVGAMAAQNVGPPEDGTLEHLLMKGDSSLLIPTHLGKGLPRDAFTALAVRHNPNPGYFPFTPECLTEYDALALLAVAD